MLQHHNQLHVLPLSSNGHSGKEWREKESFSVSSCVLMGEMTKQQQKLNNQMHFLPLQHSGCSKNK